jgi:hydroxymethylglutaryl-CoA reductase
VAITRKILGVKSARELAEVCAAVGLVQNLAALRALVTVGIQKGHMTLHARNVALSAGALGELAINVADEMIREGRIRFDRARELIKQFMKGKKS